MFDTNFINYIKYSVNNYQAARKRMGPPRKHMGAITAPMMPVCTIHAICLGPKPGLYSIPLTTIPDPIMRAIVTIID